MKIGRHYEMDRISKEDLGLMAEKVGARPKVLTDMYSDLREHVIGSFEKLKDDSALDGFEKVFEDIFKSVMRRVL